MSELYVEFTARVEVFDEKLSSIQVALDILDALKEYTLGDEDRGWEPVRVSYTGTIAEVE